MHRKRLIRQGLLIFALALAHCVASFFAVMVSFGDVIARFDTSADETRQEHFARRVADTLTFPASTVTSYLGSVHLGRWANLLWYFNSILWAMCFYAFVFGVSLLVRRRRRPCVKTHG